MNNKIVSIQSKLVYGYVGSNIAELAIQLHELDVIAFPTVYLSAHTGHQPSYGMRVDKRLFEDLITGIENIGVVDSVAHIISGYIGVEDIIDSACDFIRKIKKQDPNRLYICDPVMGDDDKIYVSENVVDRIITKLLPLCDILTPNHFEFESIIGTKVRLKEDILQAIDNHPVLKDKTVVITSCQLENMSTDKIYTAIVKADKYTTIEMPRVDMETTGTGDLFTAVTAAQLALGKSITESITHAAKTVRLALQYTMDQGNTEMNAKSVVRSILL